MREVFQEIIEAMGHQNFKMFIFLFLISLFLIIGITGFIYRAPMKSTFSQISLIQSLQNLHEN